MGKTGKIIKIFLIILLILILFIVAAIFFYRVRVNYHFTDGPGMSRESLLTSLTYQEGGGMLGDSYSIKVTKDEENPETIHIVIKDQPSHDAEIKVIETTTTNGVLLDLENMIHQYKLESWNDLPLSEVQLLDGGSTRISFSYHNGESFTFSDTQEIPSGQWKVFNMIRDRILQELEKDE